MRTTAREAEAKENETKGLYSFQDFDGFLRRRLRERSEKPNGASLRELSRKTEISLGSLSMYITGKQKLSEKNYQKLKTELHLSPKELRYLDLLRKVSYAETQELKLEALNALGQIEEFRANHSKTFEASQYLASWFNIAIRELVGIEGFKLDADWIQKRLSFPTSTSHVQKAIDFLIQNKFIQTDSRGKVSLSEKDVYCEGGTYLLTLAAHHRQMLELAKESIRRCSSKERHLSGISFSFRKEDLNQVKSILDEALEKIRALSESVADHNSVFHVEVAAFPVAQAEKEIENVKI